VLTPGLDVETGEDVLHREGHAHLDAAERVDETLEAREVHVHDVVDRHPRELVHGGGDLLRAVVLDPALERRVDLALADAGDVRPQVAREREEHGLLLVRHRVDQHDRVGPVRTPDIRVRPEGHLLGLVQPCSGVAPEQQVVA
jgi:hypothetical protein